MESPILVPCLSPKPLTRDTRRSQNQIKPPHLGSLVGSSNYPAISDDALKDEDNAGWVLQLDSPIQVAWVERIGWIRLVDRLAENDLVCAGDTKFAAFLTDWQTLLKTGQVKPESPYSDVLQSIRDRWFGFQDRPRDQQAIHAWDHYLAALRRYHVPHLVIDTYGDYEQMLIGLAGAFFQILPFLPESQRAVACQFGVVDQFYNHLRDLQEDTLQGICYLPTELLNQFGVSRQELIDQHAPANPNYTCMMQFWLDDYLPRVRNQIWALCTTTNLHASWQVLCDWSLHRYCRIERVFRACHFDYTRFPQIYWQQVSEELPFLLAQVNGQ